MWLWNALMPGLFGLKTIGYWQGVGLVILARVLFGFSGHFNKMHEHCQAHKHPEWMDYNAW